jgi:hypothetical protein
VTKQATTAKLRDLATPVTQRVVEVKKLPAPVEPKDPYRTVQAIEPKPDQQQQHRQNKQQQTASRKSVVSTYDSSEYDYEEEGAVISSGHQDKRIINAKSDHDELEGDQGFYDESPSLTEVDATMSVSAGGRQDDFYAKPVAPSQRRQQSVQHFPQPETRRQPQTPTTSIEEADVEQHQAFDYSKTIFRTPVNSGHNSRQQQQFPHTPANEPVQQRENGRPATYVDETTETERHQPLKVKQGQQPGVRRQQQQQQQRHQQPSSSERNTSPPEVPVFEAERPSFYSPNLQASPNQQQRQFEVGQHHHQRQQQPAQQQAGEWPPRHPTADLNRKNKPRNPPHHPEEYQQHQQPSDNFGNAPRHKSKNPPEQHYQEEREDLQSDPQPPYRHQPPPYRPEEVGLNYDQPEEQHRPKEHHRPNKEHHQPIYDYQDGQQNGKKNQRPRRPPTETHPAPEFDPVPQNNPWLNHQNQPEENTYDPYDQQNQEHHPQHHEQEEQQRRPQEHQTEEPLPIAPTPGRRPPGGRPTFQSGEQFNGADNDEKGNNDGDFDSPGPFKAPPPHRPHHPQPNNRQRPHRPPPSHQRPKDASIVTQGLNTLKVYI